MTSILPSTPTPAIVAADLISNLQAAPAGVLISHQGGEFALPDDRRQQFAVIKHGPARCSLLVTREVFGSASMFDIKRRLHEKKYTHVVIAKATNDVIQILYERNTEEGRGSVATMGDRTRVEDLIAELIDAAHAEQASDIHIETRGAQADIFFRVNGSRRFYQNVSHDTAKSIGVVLYSVYADASSKDVGWDPQQVMDGAVEWSTASGQQLQLRFSSSPIYPSSNFHIVIRILSMDASGLGIGDLGYEDHHLQLLDIMISGSSGMVILCGPTNSGKSTTTQAMMSRLHNQRGDTIKMITVEDPVEYRIPGACQISVARKSKLQKDSHTGSVFTTFLRGTLRQDPDVVMLGEVRDHDSAVVLKDLVLAGRKLVATLHTYSALWSYVRLRELGVPWEILTMPGFISGIVYQRLVPVLCQECSIPLVGGGAARLPKEVLYRVQQVSDLTDDKVRVKGDGCEKCKFTGVSGRTVCAEFVLPDRGLLRHLAAENFLEAESYWRKSGLGAVGQNGVTALAHGILKMRRGLVDPVDIEHQIALLTSDMVQDDVSFSNSEINALSGQSSRHY